jgi:hypothetical protein
VKKSSDGLYAHFVEALTAAISCNRSLLLISADDCDSSTCTLHLAMLPSCAKTTEEMWKTKPSTLMNLSVEDVEAGALSTTDSTRKLELGIVIGMGSSLLLVAIIWCCKSKIIPLYLKNHYYGFEFFVRSTRRQQRANMILRHHTEDTDSLVENSQL